MRHFDLNVQDVLDHWTIPDAIRELIANAIDEHVLSATPAPEVLFEPPDTVVVRDWGRGLRIDHFTQNEDEEKLREADSVIGKFGVGLKDALATLHRHRIEVRIASVHGSFSLRETTKHGFDDIVTLHVAFDETKRITRGTDIRLIGASAYDLRAAQRLFLHFNQEEVLETNDFGAILARTPDRPARIYIQGVLANEEPEFMFSYDIRRLTKKMREALNRERRSVGRSAYTDRVKTILLRAESPAVVAKLVEAVTSDVDAEEVGWADVAQHALLTAHRHGSHLFVSSNEAFSNGDLIAQATADGLAVTIVPDRWLTRLKESGEEVRTLEVYAREYNESFAYEFIPRSDLSPHELYAVSLCRALAGAVGVPADSVPPVFISEGFGPLRTDVNALWEGPERRIIVRRAILSDPDKFASSFLHELAHCYSGADDCTREFESALAAFAGTAALGRVEAESRAEAADDGGPPMSGGRRRRTLMSLFRKPSA